MKILQIRFMNLNSLVGEWKIDLTHPAYILDSLFAITGPTGAGKSTILDAICLAIYGRTPRLDKVNKSSNEIMSRQTSECFAEVIFETQKGGIRHRYCCHWSQHRARKRPDGELQMPKHEISDVDSGRIVTEKIRGVAEQIEIVTGMDFDRFTRSMLLAQGGLTAFLQANSDERAPILEQITGTEIYGQISIKVHERRSSERKKLDLLMAEISSLQILSEEDEQQLRVYLKKKMEQELELCQHLSKKQEALLWLNGINELQQELLVIEEQMNNLKIRENVFAPKQEALKEAMKALELQGEYFGLINIRHNQEENLKERLQCQKDLPTLENDVKNSQESRLTIGELLEKKKEEQKNLALIIRKVRELDLKIKEKETPIKKIKEVMTGQKNHHLSLVAKQNAETKDLENKRSILQELITLLVASKSDEALVEQFAGIRERIDLLKRLHKEHTEKIKSIKQTEIKVQETSLDFKKETENQSSHRTSLEDLQGLLSKKQQKLKNILEERDLVDWRNDLYLFTEKKASFEKEDDALQLAMKSKKKVEALKQEHHHFNTQLSTISEQLSTHLSKKESLEKESELLEKEISSLKMIQDFETARHQLQDGKACPLCGSLEHPFTQNKILTSAPDKTMKNLMQVREDLKAITNTIMTAQIKKTGLNKDIEQNEKEQTKHLENMRTEETLELLNEKWDLSQKENDINLQKLSHAKVIVQTAEIMEKELSSLSKSVEKAKELSTRIELELQQVLHLKENSEQELKRLKDEEKEILIEKEKLSFLLHHDLSLYLKEENGDDINKIETLDQYKNKLIFLRDQWLKRQKEKVEIDQSIVLLEMKTQQQAEQILKYDSEIKYNQEQLTQLEHEQDLLRQERFNLFSDKNPDKEEHDLSDLITEIEKKLEESNQKLSRATQELRLITFRIQELEKSYASRTSLLQLNEEAFSKRLREFGFMSEESFKEASLPEEERKRLAIESQKLIDEKNELNSREQGQKQKLAVERQKKITNKSQDEINHELLQLVDNQKNLQREMGAIQQKLKDNNSLKIKQQERMKYITTQRKECSRWETLHELIGSADGKKYRNFAQGLTFEMMVRHANKQLQKMTDRYLLIRDSTKSLELNVIDNYQAGEIRSTKNLSGGESFIVSLSLALGLSHMASKNVRVDSLFLDEGFGTLDEEALQTALETLAGLQQDGKLIGVISHISALKDRISTQIEIVPQSGGGGKSVISGPGCSMMRL